MKHKIKITNGEIKYKVSVHNADKLVFRAICNKNLIKWQTRMAIGKCMIK